MNSEKQKEEDAIEKELKYIIQKLGNEKEALIKILKNTGPESKPSRIHKQGKPK